MKLARLLILVLLASLAVFSPSIARAVGGSTDATLSNLTVSAGVLNPGFAPATTGYAVNAAIATTTTTITPTSANASATLSYNVNGGGFTAIATGGTSSPITLNATGIGTPILVKVISADTTVTGFYTITITRQAPVIFTLGTTLLTEAPAAGSDSVLLATSPTTGAWTATANDAWLTMTAGSTSGTGSGVVVFSFTANTGVTRTGTLTIAGQTVTVTQAGTGYVAVSATTALFTGQAQVNGIAVDTAGNVFFTQPYATPASIKKRALDGTISVVTTNVGAPFKIVADASGNLFFSDSSTVKKWTASTGLVTTVMTSSTLGVAVDGAGNVYGGHSGSITKWTAATGIESTLVSTGISRVWGLVVSPAGDIYFADSDNAMVKKWTATTGQVTTVVASGIVFPTGIALDGTGNIYISENNGGVSIKKWSAITGTVSGVLSYSLPSDLVVDAAGNLYVSGGGAGTGTTVELPRAFVNTTAVAVPKTAGSGTLPVVLPATANLAGVFVPTSNQSWLTVDSVAGGVVNFSYAVNTGVARSANLTVLGRTIAVNQAAGLFAPGTPVYPVNPATYPANVAITANTPTTTGGAPASFAITSGTLPAGLAFSTTTGAITGTPTAVAQVTLAITATNAAGTSTPAASLPITVTAVPSVTTSGPSAVGLTAATMNGTVAARFSSTAVTFQYGLNTGYGSTVAATPATLTNDTGTSVSATLAGLPRHTQYHYRVSGTNAVGTANGADQTFTTLNSTPTATAGSVTTAEDTASEAITLAGADADGDTLTLAVALQPAHGTLTGSGNTRTYTPTANYSGSDAFTFTASDAFGGTSTAATVSITVTAVNDAPVVTGGTFTVAENTATGASVGTVTSTDVESNTVTYAITAGNTGTAFAINSSTGAITVAGALDFETLASYTLTVTGTDNGSPTQAGTATVTVTVANVNEAPVVAVNAGGGALVRTTLVNFTGSSGANPGSTPYYGALVQGSDGSFYGMTSGGGTSGAGTVFKMTAAGVRTTLVNFTGMSGANPGSSPYGSLVEGSDGSFYGMTSGGGTSDAGTVFKMTAAGVQTTLVNFTGTSGANPGSYPYGALVQGSDGSFYGMTQHGGTISVGTVFKMTPAGVRTTLVNFTQIGTNPGSNPSGSLVEGIDGNFYGMTQAGGTRNIGTVFKMTPAGVRTTLVNFTGDGGANPGSSPYGSLVQGSDGSFYGMTSGDDTGNIGTVFKMTALGVQTTLVNFTGTSGANPGSYPFGSLVEGSDGSFYGMTAGGGMGDLGTVFKMTALGVQTTLVNFTGTSGANPGSYPSGSLVQGSDGRFYGMTSGGGTSNAGTVFKLAFPTATATGAEGAAVTQAGTFSDPEGNATVTLSASSGTVTKNDTAGTWSWSPAAGFDGPPSSTVTITATDTASATATAAFTFSPTNTAPAVAISAPATANEDASVSFTFTATDAATADQTAGFAWSLNYGDGTGAQSVAAATASPLARTHLFANPGTFNVTATATDKDSGVSSVAQQSITILDVTPPDTTITSTQPTLTNSTSATISFTGTDNVAVTSFEGQLDSGAYATVTSPVSLSGLAQGAHTFSVRATDAAGNVDATPATVSWSVDTIAPTFTLPANITAEATSAAGRVVTYSASVSDTDGSGVATSSFMPASGSTFAIGIMTVNASATDLAGNTATGSFTVTVQDTTNPVVTVPANISVAATGAAGTAVSFAVSASDVVDGSVAAIPDHASGNTFPIGTTTVVVTATDGHLNTGSASFTVTVGNTAPVVAVDGGGAAAIGFDDHFTAPAVAGVPPGWTDPGFDTTPGSTIVQSGTVVTITDTRSGGGPQFLKSATFGAVSGFTLTTDIASMSADVDGNPQAFMEVGAFPGGQALVLRFDKATNTLSMSGGTGGTLVLGTLSSYTGGAIQFVLTADADSFRVTSPTDNFDSGDQMYTAIGAPGFDSIDDLAAPLAVLLGVESSTGTNEVTLAQVVYDRVVLAATGAGGGSTTVTVDEGTDGTKTGTFSDAEGKATVTLTASTGIVTQDNEAGTWSWTKTGADGPANETVTITATDVATATATADFSFTVTNVAPTATITAALSAPVDAPVAFTFTATDVSTVDQAAGFAWSLDFGDGTTESMVAGTGSPLAHPHTYTSPGTYTVSLTVVDKDGATSVAVSHPITINDVTAPVMAGVPANITVPAANPVGTVVSFSSPTATDAVDGSVAVTCVPASGSLFPVGTTTVTCTAIDAASNTRSVTFTVTVETYTSVKLSKGDAVSGEPIGTIYRVFGIPSMNNARQVAYTSTIFKGGAVTPAIFVGNPATVLVRKGGAAPVSGATFATFKDPMLAETGRVAFYATMAGTSTARALFTNTWTGAMEEVARVGGTAPGTGGAKFASLGNAVLSPSGDTIFFNARLVVGSGSPAVGRSNAATLWAVRAGGDVRLLLQQGKPAAIGALGSRTVSNFSTLGVAVGAAGHGYGAASSGGASTMWVKVQVSDGGTAVGAFDGAGNAEWTYTNDVANVPPGYGAEARWARFSAPTQNPAGGVAFVGFAKPGKGTATLANDQALFAEDDSYVLQKIAAEGDVPADGEGAKFAAFEASVSGSGARAAFVARLAGTGVTIGTDRGLWYRDESGTLGLVAREGGHPEGTPVGVKWAGFSSLSLPEEMGPLFVGKLLVPATGQPNPAGVTKANNLGLWAVDSTGTLQLLARAGSPLTVGGPVVKIITVLSTVIGSPAQTRSFNGGKHVLCRVTYASQAQGIVELVVP